MWMGVIAVRWVRFSPLGAPNQAAGRGDNAGGDTTSLDKGTLCRF